MRDLEHVEVRSRAEWRSWLKAHHDQTDAIWLVTWKKAAGEHYLPYGDLVEEALAFGWVDSLPRALDEKRSMRLLAPRKRGSAWSAANKKRVEDLISRGLMTAAGLAVVEAAKRDGSWSKINAAQALQMPSDLKQRLTGTARANFEAFPPSTKKAIYEWILSAKTALTRDKRIVETITKAAANLRANQWRQ